MAGKSGVELPDPVRRDPSAIRGPALYVRNVNLNSKWLETSLQYNSLQLVVFIKHFACF